MNRYVYFIVLVLVVVQTAYAKKVKCPSIPPGDDTADQMQDDANSLMNFTKYDTSEMKFYVITPKSYPHFANPDGKDVNWSTLDCKGKQVLVNCHGFRASGLETWVVDFIRTYVQEHGGCAVSVDYGGSTKSINYWAVVGNTDGISDRITEYVADNICKDRNCNEQLQFHGHSWGAHTCGIAGYKLGQRNPSYKPARLIASDAAGPYFNTLKKSDPTLHLSPQSANVVINIKTSQICGDSKKEWAHQTQYVGACGTHQAQCNTILGIIADEGCDHQTSIYITKSTMIKSFPQLDVTKCNSCQPLLTMLEGCTNEHDLLGWKSQGKPGLFIRKDIPLCLNTTLNSSL